MQELKLTKKFQDIIQDFISQVKNIYTDNLISIILYGSAASGEFIDRHSNINLLIILNNTELSNLNKISAVINKKRFSLLNVLFFTEDYIKKSTDVFPIEFLDMKENYIVLWGRDILKGIEIDIKNLRFQCEQELKGKLITLKQLYLKRYEDKSFLENLLFKSFTSMMHILRNVIRIKGRQPPYLKQDILKEIGLDFKIDWDIWGKILMAKNKQIKLSKKDTQDLFINFVRELENIIDIVDKL